MDEIKPSDCVFPMLETSEPGWQFGLSKREYFAAKAMQGMITDMGPNGYWEGSTTNIAQWSVELADALIAALNEAK